MTQNTSPTHAPRKNQKITPGMVFGRLTVVSRFRPLVKDGKNCLCRCSCGTENFETRAASLTKSRVASCGCLRAETSRLIHSKTDLTGQTFGKLTAVERIRAADGRLNRYRCICACGKESKPLAHHLRSGQSTSCGCSKYKKRGVSPPKKREKKRREPREVKAPVEQVDVFAANFGHGYRNRKTEAPAPPARQPESRQTMALRTILGARRTYTPWRDISELVDLPIEECKRLAAEAEGRVA